MCNMAKPKNFTHKELADIFWLEITCSQECIVLIGTRSQEFTIYNMKKYRGEKSRSHIVTPIVTVSPWINGSERAIWNQIVTDGVKQFSYWMPNIGTIAIW